MSLQDTLSAFLVQAKDAGCQRLLVAYSGGVDSHVLLFQLNELNKGDFSIPLDAIYINHNLQPKALEWGEHCQNICQSLNIPFKQIDVQAKPETGESPEEKARTARYQAFSDELQSNHWLVTAQHLDDQAETFLLQLLRGSGVDGLSAMPSQRNLGKGCHHRPFLSISRQQIEQCAKDHDLKWVEDPTNQDRGVPRNYLRQNVLPAFKGKWPET
ncbi:MAG: tRNA lysidine(34) synthetase TilS, partial [Gammaproteobacteria bacterium]